MNRSLVRVIAVGLISFLVVGGLQMSGAMLMIRSQDAGKIPPGPFVPHPHPLDSLTLIDDDYQAGIIDKETATRYKAYAMFDRARLPSKYASDEPSDPTMTFLELRREFLSFSDGLRAELQSYGIRPIEGRDPSVPSVGESAPDWLSSSSNCEGYLTGGGTATFPSYYGTTHFRVHYTTTGTHASSAAYATTIGDNLETGWNQNNVMKWKLPRPDGTRGGGTNKIDFYIADLAGVWGVAFGMYLDTTTSNPNDMYGYVCVDKDLPTTPYNLQQVTPVHEFHHLVQYAYNVYGTGWYFESFSVWFEEKVFPGNNRWVSRATTFLDNPHLMLTSTWSDREYGSGIWWLYIDDMLSEDVVRRVQDFRANDPSGVDNGWSNVADAFAEYYSAPSSNMFHDFSISNWYTSEYNQHLWGRGSRYVAHDASLLASPAFIGAFSGAPGSWTETGTLQGYGAHYVAFSGITPSSITFNFNGEDGKTFVVTIMTMTSGREVWTKRITLTGAANTGSYTLSSANSYVNVIIIIRNMVSATSSTGIGWTLSWA